MNFSKRKAQIPWGTYVVIVLAVIIILYLFLYRLVTCQWKAFEESYNFVIERILIKIHMKILCSHKILNTIIPWGNMV
jgi:uncharacterized membrane protein